MPLVDEMKVALRVSGDAFDDEVAMLIASAVADMKRVGVDPSLLEEESMGALEKAAVYCYCKAAFGFDNSDAPRFEQSYRQIVCDLLNSSANIASKEQK